MQPLVEKPNNKINALVIEPTQLYQDIFTHLMGNANFDVTIATTGTEAMRLIGVNSYDLITISMQLPDTKGNLLCAKLRAIPRTIGIPIVLISADDNSVQQQKALVSGATEVFQRNELTAFSTYLDHFIDNFTRDKSMHGRILYIEDQVSVANVTRSLLTRAGYSVNHFSNAEQAFNELMKSRYDLILTDIMLQGNKTGYTLIREIQKFPGRYAQIPILAISGISDIQRKIELLSSGVSDYIQKPVLDEELLARVHNLVRMRHLLDQVELQRTEMLELAMHDQLTNLYNRHFLMDFGPKKIREAHRHNTSISLFMIDLDYFKKINDEYGHTVGDTVLKEVAHELAGMCRGEDICARFGGEEFIMLLSHCDYKNAINKAELIRRTIEAKIIDGLKITASIGVATASAVTTDVSFDKLFEAADKAVYRAKEAGRNQVDVVDMS